MHQKSSANLGAQRKEQTFDTAMGGHYSDMAIPKVIAENVQKFA